MPLGRPVDIDYPVPAGWMADSLASGEGYSVLSQSGGAVTIVPLSLDTLDLPELTAWSGSDTIQVGPPVVVVDRTLPDTVYTISPFPAPALFVIPPGLPEDYLSALRFWIQWGPGPAGFPWLVLAAAAVAIGGAAWAVIRSRRRKAAAPMQTQAPAPADLDPAAAALALLESAEFASGDWRGLFREIDAHLRRFVTSRFGADTTALTWRQISSRIRESPGAGEFLEESGDLVGEIRMQRYAGWGSSRERAEAWVRKLAGIVGRGRA